MNVTHTPAEYGTPCGWDRQGRCESGGFAVHVTLTTLPGIVQDTALCAFHSPWDVEAAK